MAQRLQEAEKAIERLQSGGTTTSMPDEPESTLSPITITPPNDRHISRVTAQETSLGGFGFHPRSYPQANFIADSTTTGMPNLHSVPQVRRTSTLSRPAIPSNDQQRSNAMQEDPTAINLSLDQHGEICYYGPTSALHDPPGLDGTSPRSSAIEIVSNRNRIRDHLLSHAKESTVWEQFALGNAAIQTGIPQKVMAKLLQLHFTWVAPMFMWVYRPAFMRKLDSQPFDHC